MSVQAFIEGNLGELLRAQAAAVDRGAVRALRLVTRGIRAQINRQVRGAGFSGGGRALAKTVRSRVRGNTAEAEGIVYSKAVYRNRPGGAADLIQVFAQATTISARGDGWLAIPTEYAPIAGGRGVRRRMSPKELIASGVKLVFLPAGPNRMVAVRREAQGKGRRNIVTHVLVRQVSLRQRLDLQSTIDRWTAALPEIFAAEINREADASALLQRYGG